MSDKWKKPVMWISVSITIAVGMIATGKVIFCLLVLSILYLELLFNVLLGE